MPSKFAAPRGTQDLIPPDSARWRDFEAAIHDLARRYGYLEIRTPVFESTELFVRGVGDTTDIVEKEMYAFVDKGGRNVTLRPEWTAPAMRAALQHGLFAQGSQRLYYLGPIFRYERPQAGRYRQAHQFGVECVGFRGPEADAEVIALAADLLSSYRVRDVTLHLNTIGDSECRPKYRQALIEYFTPLRETLSEESQRRLERNPLRILDSKADRDRAALRDAPQLLDLVCEPCREHFALLRRYLDEAGIAYRIDPHVVRGLDYYTRTVFEFVSGSLGAQSTVCAGGRYDDLVKSLGGPDLPAVGFGLGIERFLSLTPRNDAGDRRSGVQAIALGPEARARLLPLTISLRRDCAFPVYMDYDDRALVAQFKAADRNGARFALILGSNELAAGEIVLRDLQARSDRRLPLAGDLAKALVEGEA